MRAIVDGRRVMYRDDTLPHQIRLYLVNSDIAVSCVCLRVKGAPGTYLEVRGRWEADEAQAVYRAHLSDS